mmetsp:Transcript_22514/g.50212  ORF Transcript_22514/g.50212 Transcript_22514/m.50212 type:complete len:287 (+) Transcript_22514:514-1374(+)
MDQRPAGGEVLAAGRELRLRPAGRGGSGAAPADGRPGSHAEPALQRRRGEASAGRDGGRPVHGLRAADGERHRGGPRGHAGRLPGAALPVPPEARHEARLAPGHAPQAPREAVQRRPLEAVEPGPGGPERGGHGALPGPRRRVVGVHARGADGAGGDPDDGRHERPRPCLPGRHPGASGAGPTQDHAGRQGGARVPLLHLADRGALRAAGHRRPDAGQDGGRAQEALPAPARDLPALRLAGGRRRPEREPRGLHEAVPGLQAAVPRPRAAPRGDALLRPAGQDRHR